MSLLSSSLGCWPLEFKSLTPTDLQPRLGEGRYISARPAEDVKVLTKCLRNKHNQLDGTTVKPGDKGNFNFYPDWNLPIGGWSMIFKNIDSRRSAIESLLIRGFVQFSQEESWNPGNSSWRTKQNWSNRLFKFFRSYVVLCHSDIPDFYFHRVQHLQRLL